MVSTKGFHFRAQGEHLRLSVTHTCTLKGDILYFPQLLRKVPTEYRELWLNFVPSSPCGLLRPLHLEKDLHSSELRMKTHLCII